MQSDPTQTTDRERVRALCRRAEANSIEELMLMAITAERERCAVIVRSWKCDPLLDNEGNMSDLADAIEEPADAK